MTQSPETRERIRRWTRILAAYFSTQTVVQLLGIAAGLLFVNFMPVHDWALYTLALSVVTFFIFMTDLGSSTSLLHFFHAAQRGEGDFAPFQQAVWSLRRSAYAVGTGVVAAAFPLVALGKGFGRLEVGLATAAILLAVGFQVSVSLSILSLRLADRYGLSYRAELAGAGLRLALAALLVTLAWQRAWAGVLATACGTALAAWLARDGRPQRTTLDLAPYRKRVLRYLLPTLPGAFYFAVQAPLVVWLAASFGGTRNIAEVGALARLGLAVGLISGLVGTVFLPRLARIADERLYRRRFLQFGGALAAFAGALLAAAALVPQAFLFLLGDHYAGLDDELLLVVGGAGVSLLDGYVVNVNLARSWTRWQGGAVLALVAVQAILVAALPLATTRGVLSFNLLSAVAALAGQLTVATVGFTRPRWVAWA